MTNVVIPERIANRSTPTVRPHICANDGSAGQVTYKAILPKLGPSGHSLESLRFLIGCVWRYGIINIEVDQLHVWFTGQYPLLVFSFCGLLVSLGSQAGMGTRLGYLDLLARPLLKLTGDPPLGVTTDFTTRSLRLGAVTDVIMPVQVVLGYKSVRALGADEEPIFFWRVAVFDVKFNIVAPVGRPSVRAVRV